jgi:O-antigen/teichoic acid export membrane protein
MKASIAERWQRARSSPEGRRSVWTSTGLVVSSVLAAIVVVIIGRELGTGNTGVYYGIGAIVNLAAFFGALGAREMLLQRGSRDATALPSAWGVLLAANVVVGVPLVAITIAIASFFLDAIAIDVIAMIAVAEFVSNGLVKSPGNVWVALDRFKTVTTVAVFDSSLRLGAALTLLGGDASVRKLATAMLVAMVVGAVVVNLAVHRAIGRPRLTAADLRETCRVGAPFSVAAVSGQVQTNIDQFMLLRANLLVDTGLYATGVRVMQYSMLPMHALMGASQREYFRHGEHGVASGLAYGRRMLVPLVGIAAAGAIVAIVASPFLGMILGDEFDGITPVVIALVGFPAIRAWQTMYGASLVGSGHQGFVARAQIGTAALNIALNLPLIAWLGWGGAVISTYVCELVFLALIRRGAMARSHATPPAPSSGA